MYHVNPNMAVLRRRWRSGVYLSRPVDCRHLRGVGSQHMTLNKLRPLRGPGLLIIKTLVLCRGTPPDRPRPIEQISGDQLVPNQALCIRRGSKRQQLWWTSSKWVTSESGLGACGSTHEKRRAQAASEGRSPVAVCAETSLNVFMILGEVLMRRQRTLAAPERPSANMDSARLTMRS